MEPVEIEFEVRATDLLRANVWWLFRRWYTLPLYLLIAGGSVYIALTHVSPGFEFSDLGVFFAPFLFLVVVPAAVCWAAWASIRNLPPKQRRHRYQFSEAAVQIDTGLSRSAVEWEAVQRTVERRQAFYVFLHKSAFQVVPKRGIRNGADLSRLRKILQAKLGSKAELQADEAMAQA